MIHKRHYIIKDFWLSGVCLKCSADTDNAKPYCKDHIEYLPYAAKVIAGEKQRQREISAAENGFDIVTDIQDLKRNIVCRDLITVLSRYGRPMSFRELCRRTHVSRVVGRYYVNIMCSVGIVSLMRYAIHTDKPLLRVILKSKDFLF